MSRFVTIGDRVFRFRPNSTIFICPLPIGTLKATNHSFISESDLIAAGCRCNEELGVLRLELVEAREVL